MKLWLFWILWGFDALIALVFLFFFVEEMGEGYITAANAALWAMILIGLAVVLIGSCLFRSKGLLVIAFLLLGFPALPALGFVLIMAVAILSGERMN